MTDPVFQKIAIKALKKGKNILDDNNSVTQLLLRSQSPWTNELILAVLNQFKTWLSAKGTSYWSGRHFKEVLKVAAYRVNPNMAEKLHQSWLKDSNIWGKWEKEIDDFIRTLRLREQMIRELGKK